jgi:hypothetical protein
VFVAGSLMAWGMVADGYRPDRFDVLGALVCLAGSGSSGTRREAARVEAHRAAGLASDS